MQDIEPDNRIKDQHSVHANEVLEADRNFKILTDIKDEAINESHESNESFGFCDNLINPVTNKYEFQIGIWDTKSDDRLVKWVEFDSPRKKSSRIVFMSNQTKDLREAGINQKFFDSTHKIDNSALYPHQSSIMDIGNSRYEDDESKVISTSMLKSLWKSRYILPDGILIGPYIKKYHKRELVIASRNRRRESSIQASEIYGLISKSVLQNVKTKLSFLCIPDPMTHTSYRSHEKRGTIGRLSPISKQTNESRQTSVDTVVYSGSCDYKINLLFKPVCDDIIKDRKWNTNINQVSNQNNK